VGNYKLIDNQNNKIIASSDYNYAFNKETGFTARWGATPDDDPQLAPFPELLDLEISVGNCSTHCQFCYKSNTPNDGYHMTLKTFNSIMDKMSLNAITIELESGDKFTVLPSHKFILLDGSEIYANDLSKDDNIAWEEN